MYSYNFVAKICPWRRGRGITISDLSDIIGRFCTGSDDVFTKQTCRK
jgi:hypothetical protein